MRNLTGHLYERGRGGLRSIVALVIIIVVIGGFLLWLYSEPTWWESFLGKTRWDKIMEFLGDLIGK